MKVYGLRRLCVVTLALGGMLLAACDPAPAVRITNDSSSEIEVTEGQSPSRYFIKPGKHEEFPVSPGTLHTEYRIFGSEATPDRCLQVVMQDAKLDEVVAVLVSSFVPCGD